jgi:hypothetical protein
MVVVSANRPVKMQVRAGTQTGQGVTAWLKLTPWLASLSRFGVLIILFPEYPAASQRCWSVMIINILGILFTCPLVKKIKQQAKQTSMVTDLK